MRNRTWIRWFIGAFVLSMLVMSSGCMPEAARKEFQEYQENIKKDMAIIDEGKEQVAAIQKKLHELDLAMEAGKDAVEVKLKVAELSAEMAKIVETIDEARNRAEHNFAMGMKLQEEHQVPTWQVVLGGISTAMSVLLGSGLMVQRGKLNAARTGIETMVYAIKKGNNRNEIKEKIAVRQNPAVEEAVRRIDPS